MAQLIFTDQEMADLEEFLKVLFDREVQEVTGIDDSELDAIYSKVYAANHY